MTTAAPATSADANDEHDQQIQAVFRRIAITFGELNPTGTLGFDYITEGAANVVWKVRFHDSNLSQHDSSIVLRMRKDIASTVPMQSLKREFEDRIAPLFAFDPGLLLPVDLVLLCESVVEELNGQLRQLEASGTRKILRRGMYHPSFEIEPYAMIMPNLGHGPGSVIEFKPKWLVQSPSAPRHAQTCRTCALNARRRAKGGTGRGDSGFCPFDLLSRDKAILGRALRQIWSDKTSLPEFVAAFRSKVQPALRQLQQLQRSHNDVGLDDFQHPAGKDFSVAMALRDCSLVLRISETTQSSKLDIPSVKLLDLDLKDPGGGKLTKWTSMESELIEEGWYTTQEDPSMNCAMAFQ